MLLEKSKEETSNTSSTHTLQPSRPLPSHIRACWELPVPRRRPSIYLSTQLISQFPPSTGKKRRSFRWLLSVVWEREEEEEGVQEVRAPRCSGHSAAFPAFRLIFGWNTEISPQLGRSVCNRGRGGKEEKCQKQPLLSSAMSFGCFHHPQLRRAALSVCADKYADTCTHIFSVFEIELHRILPVMLQNCIHQFNKHQSHLGRAVNVCMHACCS